MRRFIRGLFIGCLAIVVIAAALGLYGYRSLNQVPAFYAEALAQPAAEPAKAAYQFEQEVLELQNDVRREGDWQATFSAEEINGWLANDLPVKFPRALPEHVSDPRVAITRSLDEKRLKSGGSAAGRTPNAAIAHAWTPGSSSFARLMRSARTSGSLGSRS